MLLLLLLLLLLLASAGCACPSGLGSAVDFGKLQLRGSAAPPTALHVVSDPWQKRFTSVCGAKLSLNGGGNVKCASTPTVGVGASSGHYQ